MTFNKIRTNKKEITNLGKYEMSCFIINNFDFYFPEIPNENNSDINNGINIIENQNKSNHEGIWEIFFGENFFEIPRCPRGRKI